MNLSRCKQDGPKDIYSTDRINASRSFKTKCVVRRQVAQHVSGGRESALDQVLKLLKGELQDG